MSTTHKPSRPKRPPPPKFRSSVTPPVAKDQNSLLEQGNPLFTAFEATYSSTFANEQEETEDHEISFPRLSPDTDIINGEVLNSLIEDDDLSSDDDLFQSIPSQKSSSRTQHQWIQPEFFDSSSDEDCLIVEDHYGRGLERSSSSHIPMESTVVTDCPLPDQIGGDVYDSSVHSFKPHFTSEQSAVSHVSKVAVEDPEEVSSVGEFPSDGVNHQESLADLSAGNTELQDTGEFGAVESERLLPDKNPIVSEPYVSVHDIAMSTVILYFYYSFVSVSYISGFFAGVLVFFLLLATFIAFLSYYEDIKKRLAEKRGKEVKLAQKGEIESLLNVKLESLPTLKSERFSLAYDYDETARHSSQAYPVRMQLEEFHLHIAIQKDYSVECDVARQFWQFGDNTTIEELNSVLRIIDLRDCSIFLTPKEIASDRRRRWSKKYPIRLHVGGKNSTSESVLYLYVSVARDKEEWYRRMWNVCRGVGKVEESKQEQASFFKYVSKYVPRGNLSPSHASLRKIMVSRKSYTSSHNVQLSHLSTNEKIVPAEENVNFKDPLPTKESVNVSTSHDPKSSSLSSHSQRHPKPTVPERPSLQPTNSIDSFELSLSWVNVLASRLCWDFWHEEKWKTWVMKKIDKKLQRIQRPSFLEELHITDVHLGMDMPQIKKVNRKPRVDHRGVWAYLDVSYKGSFTMTIETKVTSALFQEKQVDTRMRLQNIDISYRNQPINDDESDSEPEELHLKTEQLKIGSPGTRKSGKIRSYMNSAWRAAANSRLGKRVTEKVLSYPLVLSVEVRRLDGPVVINIPPPPSDSIWYGFERKPYLSLSAKPKVFNREVTLSYVTDWIEKKLVEVVEKKLVHPNMLDFTATPLNSGIPGDKSVSF
jgi:hypothetical protein